MKLRPSRFLLTPLLATTVLILGGCSAASPEGTEAAVQPGVTLADAEAVAAPDVDASAPSVASDRIADCSSGDARTGVFVYRATVDAEGQVHGIPPQQDGEIVRVELRAPAGTAACSGDGPHAFRAPTQTRQRPRA